MAEQVSMESSTGSRHGDVSLLDGEQYVAYPDDLLTLADMEQGGQEKYGDVSDDFILHNSSYERGFVHSANIGIFITVCNILISLLLLGLVAACRSTRVQFVFQQLLNLALSDLCFSVVVDPFTVYFELQPWELSTHFCVTYMVADNALPCVSFLVLIVLNTDRILFAMSPAFYHRVFSRAWVRRVVLLLPWLAGCGVIVPLWLLTATEWPRAGLCIYGISMTAAISSAVLSLYLPAVVLVGVTVFNLATLIGGMPDDLNDLPPRRGPGGSGRGEGVVNGGGCGGLVGGLRPLSVGTGVGGGVEAGRGRGLSPVEKVALQRSHRSLVAAVCVANIASIITQLPFGAISMLQPHCVEASCQSTIKLMQALSWLRSATFSMRPLLFICLTRQLRRTCCTSRDRRCDPCDPATPNCQSPSTCNTQTERLEMGSAAHSVVLGNAARSAGTLV